MCMHVHEHNNPKLHTGYATLTDAHGIVIILHTI